MSAVQISTVVLGVLICGLIPPLAEAHTFGAQGAGLAEGFAHPFMGVDHLLAMIAVGMWAAQRSSLVTWLAPLTFIAVMAGGALWGAQGFELPMQEPVIASSVLILGLLVAFSVRLSVAVSLSLVGCFAWFHGYAHGLEWPQAASAGLYGIGFILATALLHGIGIGLVVSSRQYQMLQRLGGSLIAATGLLLLATA